MTQQQLSGLEMQALNRFQSFVQIHMIEIDSFWKSNRMFIPMGELKAYISLINYQAEEEEIDVLACLLANDEGLVTLENICRHVPVWGDKTIQTKELFKERTNLMASESKKKFQ